VRDHFETFRAHAASLRDDDGLPRFVEQEFRAFLRCGYLAGGFGRFRCVACGLDPMVGAAPWRWCSAFGGALNLNIHLHALVLDGVFTKNGSVEHFHPVRRLTREDVAQVVALIARRVARLLERRGVAGSAEGGEAPGLWSEEAPVLAAVAAASVEGRVALGPRAGARVRRCGDPPEEVTPTTRGPCHDNAGGFDLHGGLMTPAGHRDRLERLCRYALRPPVAQERRHITSDGEIWLTLRHRWTDGTTHLRFDPLELLERLAV
jgi:hypothetical protein